MRTTSRLMCFGICSGLPFLASGQASPQDIPRTLAVMEFDNRSPTGEWQWLGKGLADMLITDLSASRRLVIVEREKLNELMRQQRLGETGLVDSSTAARVGKLAAVDWVLFGSFLKEGDQLKVEAHLLDLKTQKLLRVEWVEGRAEDVFKLEKELVRQILQRLDVPLTEAERRSIEYVPTDSIPAFEHYSLSLGHFDEGDWHRALLECRLAVRADADFLKAKARLADLYHDLGEPEHALIEYRKLITADQQNILPESVYYKMGRLLEDTFQDDAAASAAYQRIVARHPEYECPFDIRDPFSASGTWDDVGGQRAVEAIAAANYYGLRALERLALIEEKVGNQDEAARRFSQIVHFRWTHGMGLGSGGTTDALRARVWRKYGPMYWRLVRENRDSLFYPSARSLHVLPPDGGSVGPDAQPTHGYCKQDIPGVWLAPPDKEIAEVAVSVNCDGLERRHEHDCVQVEWSEPGTGIAGGRRGMQQFDIGSGWQTARFEMERGIRAVQAHVFRAPAWKIDVAVRPWSGISAPPLIARFQVDFKPEQVEAVYLDGEKKIGRVRGGVAFPEIPSGDHIVEVEWPDGRRAAKRFNLEPLDYQVFCVSADKDIAPDTGAVTRVVVSSVPGSHTYLLRDSKSRVWLVWDRAVEDYGAMHRSQESDLFCSSSIDGRSWSRPVRLSVSSSALDMRPVLQQDGHGTYWLVWLSSRDPKDAKWLWVASSEDGSKWSFPRKVVLPIADKHALALWRETHVPSFAFAIDRENTFWLIWQEELFWSEDAAQWKSAGVLEAMRGPYDSYGRWSFLACDQANRLSLLVRQYVRVEGRGQRSIFLWRRSSGGTWKDLGSLTEGSADWAGIAFDNEGCLVSVIGFGAAYLRTYSEVRGWSRRVLVDRPAKGTLHPSIALLPDGHCVVAYSCKDGIVATVCEPPAVESPEGNRR